MYFRLRHLVFPVDTACSLVLEAQGPVVVREEDGYTLRVSSFSGLRRYLPAREGRAVDEAALAFFTEDHALRVEGNALRLDLTFPQEDRWLLTLLRGGEKLEQHEVYSLEADLFALNPYKGDNHMHSFLSDGKDTPEYMAAACCRRGYDYCVLTDHWDRRPSVRGKERIDALGVDFAVLPGEEIHAPGNGVHIINMGGEKGVNDWYRDDPEGYEAAVQEKMKTITEPLSPEDKYAAASSLAIFDKIHECNGVAVHCHPCWILEGTLHESEDLSAYLFDHRTFDVYELIAGGAFEEGTQMQIAYYQEREKMPILGSSDAHQQFGGRMEPGNFTVVFAPELTVEAIRESVRAGLCVAGFENKFWGDYRLVKYAYFLKANYFPEHDQRCVTFGARMLRYVSAGSDPASKYADDCRAAESPSAPFLALRWTK